ncbi:MAG: hydroxymethylbilane synthase [Brevundimonas sp.]|jgi:hydroxymethylbilane synthase
MAQSGMMQRAVARALGAAEDSVDDAVVLVPIVTTGDRIQDRRLMDVGGKALFTKEIEQALIDGRIDLAVHSLKDVPADMPPGLVLAAIPEREDHRDAFVSVNHSGLDDLPNGALVGTASLRRQAQLLAARPDLRIQMLRGNVDTRLNRLAAGDFDAILLAASGLNRLGRSEVITTCLDVERFVPAPGQGALAIQTRSEDALAPWAAALNHRPTAVAVTAERGAMLALEGSCRTAVGAYAFIENDRLSLTAEILAPDGSARWRHSGEIQSPTTETAHDLGVRIGDAVHADAGDQELPA